jgi:hypothetical protein
VQPLDLSLAADRIGQSVQAIADNTVDSLHACCDEGPRIDPRQCSWFWSFQVHDALVGGCLTHVPCPWSRTVISTMAVMSAERTTPGGISSI